MENEASSTRSYVLGLDIGTNSVGWALIGRDGDCPTSLIAAGVRVFEAAAVGGKLEDGRDEPPNLARRTARLTRRQLWRRARRLALVFRRLQETSLLPAGDAGDPLARDGILRRLDGELRKSNPGPIADRGLPYLLRKQALDGPLSPHALGRAVYHLAQRRGFLSNRRSPLKKDEELGVVKSAIADLEKRMLAASARTLGEYFASLDPEQQRIRGRWTKRQWYIDEFERIWAAQRPHHATLLTDERKRALFQAIFHQRPLKSQKHRIGRCELEPARPRCPIAALAFQRFRLLQRVNDLTWTADGFPVPRALNADERAKVVEALESGGDLTFKRLRKLLSLPKDAAFNLEAGGEERLVGNRTASKLAEIMGDGWAAMTGAQRDLLVADVRSIESPAALIRRGKEKWGLDPIHAEQLAEVVLEEGHGAFSARTIRKLLPLLEAGTRLATARKQAYPDADKPLAPAADLPAVDRAAALRGLRNPIVHRSLTEVRKVVNAVIRKYGKPTAIRVELARDLKRPRGERERIAKANRAREKERLAARDKLIAQSITPSPTSADMEKWLLAEECGWICPYTGKAINAKALFAGEFDVEHIIPFSRSLDNSFRNKTLCWAQENRSEKRNRTPFEAYAGDPARWEAILTRVRSFKGDARAEKLRRFQLDAPGIEAHLGGFAERQLQDTRHASVLAAHFLGTLYGGPWDADGTRRVQAGAGQVTAFLRDELRLNDILGTGGVKSRADHRHHAIDAVCIALTGPSTVKELSTAAERASREGRRRFGRLAPPWDSFSDDVRRVVESMRVSHRPTRKVSGALHDQTLYSAPRPDGAGKECVHVRKPVHMLSVKGIEDIVDFRVRTVVRDKVAQVGGNPKLLEKDWPVLPTGGGRTIPIKKVRIRVHDRVVAVGSGSRARWVQSGANHHIAIVEIREVKRGKDVVKWEGQVVSLLEAARRLNAREPPVKREHGTGRSFLFSLAGGDLIEMDGEGASERRLFVVRAISMESGGRIGLCEVNDARKKEDMTKAGGWRREVPEGLRKKNCRKVTVDPLGALRDEHD